MNTLHDIKEHLYQSFPKLRNHIQSVTPLEVLTTSNLKVDEAVLKVVTGQMLSRKAAETIYQRLRLELINSNCEVSQLSYEAMIKCGLSKRKAKTIIQFSKEYSKKTSQYEAWRYLEYKELEAEVSSFWGMSKWTASMLAIFYFANPNVFPEGDGTLKKAKALLSESGVILSIDKAAPYKTYLAIYLWKFIDEKVL